MHFPINRTAHTTAFGGPVVDHWLEQKVAQAANASATQDQSIMSKTQTFIAECSNAWAAPPPPIGLFCM